MMKILASLLINALSLYVVSYLVPGFTFDSNQALIVTAVVIGLTNTFIKPVLQIIFIPLSIVTFGVTAFLINVFLLWGTSALVPGFHIRGFTTAVISSLLLSLIGLFLNKLGEEK